MRAVSTPVSAVSPASAAATLPLEAVDVLVVGAGPSGLGTAAFFEQARRAHGSDARLVVVEAANEPGGYCRTVEQDGFVFDYAGHFFHFRDPAIHAFLAARLPVDALCTVHRRARVIDVEGCEVAFPYQAHIGALPKSAFVRCLADLWQAEQARSSSSVSSAPSAPTSFKQWLVARCGAELCARFLVPYNEKLYATDLDTLDPSCMGRFFPEVRFADVMRALTDDSAAFGYNSTFTYPRRGAATYIEALRRDLDQRDLHLDEAVVAIDVVGHVATTTKRHLKYRQLVTSAPLPKTLALCGDVVGLDVGSDFDPAAFSWNRVLVFNFGFDKKARADAHWIYVARADVPFYRVGFYDVIVDGPRASLYVEIGLPQTGPVDVDALRTASLAGLRALGFITDQQLVTSHHVVMDPAYVHLTSHALATTKAALVALASHDIHSIGRYGAWTYCSIEDNLIAARDVVAGPLSALLSPSSSQ